MQNTNNRTIAGYYSNLARRLRRDPDTNHVMGDYAPMINMFRREAVVIEYPYGTDNEDPSQILTFSDGSEMWLDNPAQWVFPLNVYERDIR